MNPTFEMLIFDENGRLVKTKDPIRFITRRAKFDDYKLEIRAKILSNGRLQMNLDFHGCHVILTGAPLDFFFAFACAVKGKYLKVER